MDYHTLPRRQLQSLCKKHGIPANAANSDMADALTALLKPKPQLHADNSNNQAGKRTTRSREPALSETVSKSKDVEEEANPKSQKPTKSCKIVEEESNRKLPRVTRGRGSACAVLEAPKAATLKTWKTPTNGETESNCATKLQEVKKISTRNGANKQINSEMPANDEENVISKAMSPKSDKKKEKTGGIVLHRGRVKVRSPGNLSKSPESEKISEKVAPTKEEKGIGCLVDAKNTRKKKRSVTFADVLETNSSCKEHPSRGVNEPAKETMAEILQGADPNLPKNTNSARIAKKVVGTRKASRSVSTKDCVQAQAYHQKSTKEPVVAKVSEAEGPQAFDAEKSANIDIGGESDRKKSVRGSKILHSVGEAATADDFVEGNHIEDVPCTRRSRRLTIVPTDVKYNQDMQLTSEESKGRSKDEGSSIAVKKTEGALPAETSRRSRRKTLAPLELNHVRSNVGSASEQKEKRVSKAKDTQNKGYSSELKDEALESQQNHSEIKACDNTPVAIEAEVRPIKTKDALSVRNVHGSRQNAVVASAYQHIMPTEEVPNEMGYQNICTTEIISGKSEGNVDASESEKAYSKAPLSTSILANSEPQSLQEVSTDTKGEVETVKTTSVMPRSTRKTSKVSTHLDNGTAVSQEPTFSTQSNIVKQEGLVFQNEDVGKNIQDSEDLDVIAQAYSEQSQESLVLKSTNEPRVVDPVNNVPFNDDINSSDGFSSAFQIVTGKGEGQNQINSEDANPVSCNEEYGYNSSPLLDKVDAADVRCHETEETSSATSSECVQQGHEFTTEKENDSLEQEGLAMDGLGTNISLTEEINKKSRSTSPVSIMIEDKCSLDGNHHVKGTDFESSIDSHRDEGITASSPAAIVESTFKYQNSIDIATAEQESCTPKVHLLTSDMEKISSMTSGGAVDSVEQQPNQSVDFNLCEEDAVDREGMTIHGDPNEGLPSDGVKSVEDISMTDQLGQLSPLLASCSAEPGIALPRESACKTEQRRPRSIYKSARKAKFSVPWENRSLEENVARPPTTEDSLNSLDQSEKDAEIWGLNSHEMSCDEGDSAASEEEESSAETEETLSDTEVCNFNTEVLISNTEGDYSCSEDDTSSDTDEDTMFDSEDQCSELEGERLSGEECYESEELDTTEEEFSESEDDAGDNFEKYEASPVSQSVANSESFDALHTTHGSEYQQVEIIAASKSSLPNDGVTQAEIMNCLSLENVSNGCALNADPTDIDEKVGGQHEELQKTLSTHSTTEIQENADVLMSYNDNTAIEGALDSTCQDSDSLTALSSLFPTPASKVKEDVKCSLALPSIDILESSVSQQSGTLKTILPESEQEESIQFCFPCELSHEDVVAEVELHTMDGAEHETELCESMGCVEKVLELNGQMVELAETCSVENSLAGPTVVDCFMASPMLDNAQNSQLLESNLKNAYISDKENKQIHTSASESPCLGPCELIFEGNGAEMADPDICEQVVENLNTSPKTDVLEVQEEPDNFKVIQYGIQEDEAGNAEVKNDLDNNKGSFGMALDAQKGSEELRDLGEGTTSKLTEELMITEVATFGFSTLAVNDKLNESEAAAEQENNFSIDGSPQKQNNEDALAFDMAHSAIGTTDSIVPLESAKELELDMVSADDKIQLFSSDTSSNLLEEGEPIQLECEQSKNEAIEEEPEVIQSGGNSQSLVSQAMASNTFEVNRCSTPKCSKDSGIVWVFNHESLDEVAPTLHCVEIESVNAQVEQAHEKPLDESQSSEESNEDKETAAAHNLISKEQSMKQIDLTLLSVRKLRQMCKGNQMSAKKKTENETPARKSSNVWMSATKQVHQPNTSMHPRDLPSGNKRSALQALSSNVKAAPSAAMQTPTAKVLQRPRNLMGTYDGNEGTGKHLVTPSPQAPMSSKRDFARSHHR